MTTTSGSSSTRTSSTSRAAATPGHQRRRRWRRHAVGAAVVAVAVAAAAAVLALAPSTALAFIVAPPATAPPPSCAITRQWKAAAVGTPAAVNATPRRPFALAPPRAAAAATADEEDEDDDEDDEEEEQEGPRPPRPFTPPPIPISFESPELPSATIDGAWNALRKPLLRLGTKGVQKSHRNSLKELLAAHRAVRVKVNGPAKDVKPIADRLAAPDQGQPDPLAVVLRVKGKEFLLATPAEVAALKKGKKPGAAE